MSEARRIYDLLRGYVNNEWERLQNLERQAALDELNDAAPRTSSAAPFAPSAAQSNNVQADGEDSHARARKILGVEEKADFTEIRKAYVRLNKRTQPGTFQEGSEEARQSEDIRKKAMWAYQTLTRETPDVEKRFGSLEID